MTGPARVASAGSRWELSGSYVTDDMYVCIIGFVELSRGNGGREHLPGTTGPELSPTPRSQTQQR